MPEDRVLAPASAATSTRQLRVQASLEQVERWEAAARDCGLELQAWLASIAATAAAHLA